MLPDNFGFYTISFINKVAVPAEQIYKEFAAFGEVVNMHGDLKTRGGRVSVAFRDKDSAVEAFLTKCERWYPAMRFTLARCSKDYTGCYCLKFHNVKGAR